VLGFPQGWGVSSTFFPAFIVSTLFAGPRWGWGAWMVVMVIGLTAPGAINNPPQQGTLALFALSPVPSGQLFVAAGLMEVRLIPLTAAFFGGRLVSYAIYVGGASAIAASVPDTFIDSLTSPLGIAVQLVALAGLILFLRIDWTRVLAGRVGPSSDGEREAGS
ncbi:MAG: hypothetical protein ACXWZM_08080, partial [Solirubrobacterales bacterium]